MPNEYQSDLVDRIVAELNTAPTGTWKEYTVGTDSADYVEAKPCLDPIDFFESGQDALLVIPSVVLYNRSLSRGRQKIVTLAKGPSIALCLAIKFKAADSTGLDIANWSDVKKVIDLREDIDGLRTRRRHGGGRRSHAPDRGSENGRKGGGRGAGSRHRQTNGRRRREPNRRQCRCTHHPGKRLSAPFVQACRVKSHECSS